MTKVNDFIGGTKMKHSIKRNLTRGIGSFFGLGAGAGTSYALLTVAGFTLAAAAGTGAGIALALITTAFLAAWKFFKNPTNKQYKSNTMVDLSKTSVPALTGGPASVMVFPTPSENQLNSIAPALTESKTMVDLSETSVPAFTGDPASVMVRTTTSKNDPKSDHVTCDKNRVAGVDFAVKKTTESKGTEEETLQNDLNTIVKKQAVKETSPASPKKRKYFMGLGFGKKKSKNDENKAIETPKSAAFKEEKTTPKKVFKAKPSTSEKKIERALSEGKTVERFENGKRTRTTML